MVEISLIFINLPKHQLELELHINNIDCTTKKMVSNKTRWVAHMMLLWFNDVFPVVICTLEVIEVRNVWNAFI